MKFFIFGFLMFFSTFAVANEVTIISVQPRYVTTHQQQCETVQVYRDNSNMGMLLGGVAGGLLGNAFGSGSGNTAATIAGAVIGGGVGNSVGSDQGKLENKQVCRSVPVTIQQGETVTFSYKGRTFTQTF